MIVPKPSHHHSNLPSSFLTSPVAIPGTSPHREVFINRLHVHADHICHLLACGSVSQHPAAAIHNFRRHNPAAATDASVDSLSASACTVNYVVEIGGVKSPYAQFTFDYSGGNPLTEAETALSTSMNN